MVATSVLEVGALVDGSEDVVDPLDEASELDAAAQATFRVNCTPLLAQVDSNVAAAAVHSLAMERRENELRGLTLLIGTAAARSKTAQQACLVDLLANADAVRAVAC